MELKPSDKPSWISGGTAHLLPLEREKATFDVDRMSEAIYGGPSGVKRRKFILLPAAKMVYPEKYEWSREKMMSKSIEDFIAIHKDFVQEGYRPQRDEVGWMGEMAQQTGSMMPHFGLFLPTIMGQGSLDQIMIWLPKALNFEIIGCYAQTELSHGSNIRGLQTVAHYDSTCQEFILNTPTLGSMKWWNSNIGLVATHAAVYANLILDGKEYGLHVFMLQVRDENHETLPGIELGDCGIKLGDNAIDTGYMRLQNVRVPRQHLMSKRQHVEADGTYVKHISPDKKGSALASRASYVTMMQARAGMISLAAGRLSIAATIAVRYSCVRHQGFTDTKEGQSFQASERAVIDYQVQSYRLFKQVAIAYCIRACGNWMNLAIEELAQAANSTGLSEKTEELVKAMPEAHASSAGLKGLCTRLTADGIEDLRKCCGGHGFLLNSGIAALFGDYVWQVSAEGDAYVLLLSSARFLLKSRSDAIQGKPLSGLASCLKPLSRPDFNLASLLPRMPSSIDGVSSIQFLLEIFEYRTVAMICKAGVKMENKMKKVSFDQAWNECAILLKDAAECHIYYFMMKKFIETIRLEKDPHVLRVLEQLCALFGLQNMKDGQNWVGIIPADVSELVDTSIEQLLVQIRPNAVVLVDAFDIPDRVLNSTIGRRDGNVYEALYEGAKKSAINKGAPFDGYEEVLKPHLDLEFLSLRGKVVPELQDSKL